VIDASVDRADMSGAHLLPGWQTTQDPYSGVTYYYNVVTRQSSWTWPPAVTPAQPQNPPGMLPQAPSDTVGTAPAALVKLPGMDAYEDSTAVTDHGANTHQCLGCGAWSGLPNFSAKQRKKPAAERRCRQCIDAANAAAQRQQREQQTQNKASTKLSQAEKDQRKAERQEVKACVQRDWDDQRDQWLASGDGQPQMTELVYACEEFNTIDDKLRDDLGRWKGKAHGKLFSPECRDAPGGVVRASVDYETLLEALLAAHPSSINTMIDGRRLNDDGRYERLHLTPLEYVCKNFLEMNCGETHCPLLRSLLRHGARVTANALHHLAEASVPRGGDGADAPLLDVIWEVITQAPGTVELPFEMRGRRTFDFFALMSRISPYEMGISKHAPGDWSVDAFLADLVQQTLSGEITAPLELLFMPAIAGSSPPPPFLEWLESNGQKVSPERDFTRYDNTVLYLDTSCDSNWVPPVADVARRTALREAFESALSSTPLVSGSDACLRWVNPSTVDSRLAGSDASLSSPASASTSAQNDASEPSTMIKGSQSGEEAIERKLVAMGFDAGQVKYALEDSDVGQDPDRAVAFLLAQAEDRPTKSGGSESPDLRKNEQEEAELLEWRTGVRRFVPEVIDVEAEVVETGAIIMGPGLAAAPSCKRPLEVAASGISASSSLSRVVRVKQEKVEMQAKLSEKEKECDRLEDEYDILNDGVQPMTTTINALQTKVDALYCIASAIVPDAHKDSLRELSGRGIDVQKRNAASQIVEYTCTLLSAMTPAQVAKAAAALSIRVDQGLAKGTVVQKVREALAGTGPGGQ